MGDKKTPFSFGWIDFSKEDREAALKLIAENKTHGAVDELGLGTIRDAFANLFFPGTSTIQTRARYFLLVPYWIHNVYEDYKKKNITPDQFDIFYAKEEKNFTNELESRQPEGKDEREKGIIGATILNYEKERWLVRTIQEIYWAGIWEYHLIENKKNSRKRLSIREFEKKLLSKTMVYKANSEKKGNIFDDAELDASSADDTVFSSASVKIDTDLLACFEDIKEESDKLFSLKMTRKEAELLKRKIAENVPGTILAIALSHNSENFTRINNIGDLVHLPEYSAFENELKLAAEFSNFADFLGKRYNHLLHCDESGFDEPPAINPDLINQIFTRFELNNDLKFFLEKCYKACSLKDDFKELDEIIKNREIDLKKGRAKIGKETITEPLVDYKYTYRLERAKQIVKDILEGLKNG